MYVRRDKRLAFLAHPRTASQATAEALRGLGFVPVGNHHDYDSIVGGCLSFATVRNPWDAAVSWVFGRNKGREIAWGLPAFQKALDRNRNHWIRDDRLWPDITRADRLLRYESLATDLNRLLSEKELEPVQLPVVGASAARRGRPYQEFYTQETRDYIGRRFAAEIRELGYVFDDQAAQAA